MLLISPIPLLVFLIKKKHYLWCLPPFIALFGIYVFNIIGAFDVINNKTIYSNMYYYTLWIIMFSFYLFYGVIFIFKNKLKVNWNDIKYYGNDKSEYSFIIFLWSYSIYMFYLYTIRNGLPALFQLNLTEYSDIYALRGEKSTSLKEGMHWYRLAFSTLPAFIFIYTYILKLIKPSRKTRAIFYLNLPLVLFFSLLTLHKTPIAYLLLYLFLINLLLFVKPMNFKKILIYLGLGSFSIVLALRLYLLDRDIISVLRFVPEYFWHRVFSVYTEAHAYILQIFPANHNYFYGRTIGNPGGIFPYDNVNLSQFLGRWIHGSLMNYASPSFSQGYANFGFAGFVIVLLIMFYQIILIQVIFKKCPKEPIFLTIYILILSKILNYSNSAIENIISEIFIIVMVCILFFYYFSKIIVNNLFLRKNIFYSRVNN